ncbi:type VI secretion system protein TssA [Xanthomonas vasicola]|uniref:Type VI secretion system protein TssA n=4 Tax=Xanthomonas vasicola TaxID=56459 RepID=A0ABD7SE55_XANVA|nr:type VI secretion system protein TssA [Xanthomonas vasicola]AZR22891.1 type VI secretion system protein TssA [Xanthomonas vasicola]KGR37813.1 ImpA [Xanthomonas vasicola]KGR42686.1 ImpA [Xanthomonas vasicola]MDO6983730.1 type VI secretion system protein TssA [Xanthomonas vasicola]PPV03384.1 type VI secretion system protein ImpA [Xanthomonas vasicola]
MQIDNEPLLQPVDEQVPSGPNLEYTPEFQSLEELARPRQERALGAGVLLPDAPQWRQVAESAEYLLVRSKDLRLGILLSIARLHQDGLVGWSSGVGLLRQLLEQFWGDVHPHLDADEDNDPTERVNAIAALADSERTLTQLRNVRLFKGLHPGHFSLRDLRIVQGTLKLAAEDASEMPEPAAIDACLRDCPLEALLDLDAALAAAQEDLAAIAGVFAERTPGHGPELAPLTQDLGELRAFLRPYVSERSGSPAEPTEHAASGADNVTPSAPRAHAVEHPDDVRRMLDQLCDYYARREPSSPVPLLLRRAQRLVGLDFAALMRDLAPRGIEELQVVSGQDHTD